MYGGLLYTIFFMLCVGLLATLIGYPLCSYCWLLPFLPVFILGPPILRIFTSLSRILYKYIYSLFKMSFFVFSKIIMHPISRDYVHVLCVNKMPTGPLSRRVSLVRTIRLSEYQSPYDTPCVLVLLEDDRRTYMEVQRLPDLFAYLVDNDYRIHDEITPYILIEPRMDVICMVSQRVSI